MVTKKLGGKPRRECLSSDGNDPKEREGLMLQKRKEIPEKISRGREKG